MGEIDLAEDIKPVEIEKVVKTTRQNKKEANTGEEKQLISCLRNEKVTVKFIPREGGLVTDPKHVLYGGLGENSKRRFVVPILQSGVYVNVLTNSEKDYIEYIMGLPDNSLSVYRKVDNFWSNRGVILGKEKKVIDLSDPDQFIDYKILLSNKDFICPSEEELKRAKKATYQYVIIKEGEELDNSINSLELQSKAFMLYGQYKSDLKKLSMIIELATGKVVSTTDKKLVYSQVDKLIKDNIKKFVEAAEDVYLDTKILIGDCIEAGLIRKRGQYYYFTEGNSPICNEKQEPTLQSACDYLNSPKYQEKRFLLEAKLKS